MSYVSAQKSRLLVADYHLSLKTRQFSHPLTVDMLEVSCLTDDAKAFVPGQDTSTFTADGPLDTDASSDAQFDSIVDWTSTTPVSLAPSGFSHSSEVFLVNALKTTFETTAGVSDTVNWSVAAQTDGRTDVGKSLADLAALTADGNGTTLDGGAASGSGAVCHLHVTAYSGFDQVVFTVEDSADGSSWATIGTFATVTGITAERLVIAGTIRRYTRLVRDVTGTGSVTAQASIARR